MKIAFAADNKKGLDSLLSQHFGRCPYYILVEIGPEGKVKSIEEEDNPFFSFHQPGQVPQFIKSKGADVIIAGGMGPRAVEFFQQLSIKPVTAPCKNVDTLLADYLAGNLAGWQSCSGSHNHNC